MFGLNKTETYIFLIALAIVICMPMDCFAENFKDLKDTGTNIFKGLRSVIYPASAIGIICICIFVLFGNLNWKWLLTIAVGLIVIALCSGFIELFTAEKLDLGDKDILGGK